MLERRAIIARRLAQAARTGITFSPHNPVITQSGGMEEDSTAAAKEVEPWTGDGRCFPAESGNRRVWEKKSGENARQYLAGWFYDENHTRPQSGNVLIVAFEGGDCGFVGGGDRIQRFSGFHLVVKHAGLL